MPKKRFQSKNKDVAKKIKLNAFEKSIDDLLDFSKLKKPSPKEQENIRNAASETFRDLKSARANIRMNESDFLAIRILAEKVGMPYQTFIAHILHLYVTDQLVNINEVKKMIDAGIIDRKIG